MNALGMSFAFLIVRRQRAFKNTARSVTLSGKRTTESRRGEMTNVTRASVVAMMVLVLFIGCREERDRNSGSVASNPDPPVATSPISLDTPIIPVFEPTPLPETTQVPEPATMLLFGSGLLGLAAYGRKKFFKK